MKILDIGVGTGTISKELENYGECTHIDISNEVIDFNQDLNDWIIRGSCRTVDMFKDSKMEFNNIQYALSLSQLRSASHEFEENLNSPPQSHCIIFTKV